jgi:arabinose-5-phosphate isomerase
MSVKMSMWRAWLQNMDSFKQYYSELLKTVEALPEGFQSLHFAADLVSAGVQTVCVGVGKSGFVAQKLHASLASISVNSVYLHPAEAAHGDIGTVAENAVAVIFSKSGNSMEINDVLPFLKKRGCAIIAVCNRKDSVLGSASDVFLDIKTKREGEPLNILPLISVDISMILANMLVARVSQIKGLTVDAFARNHPGGQLGRNVSLVLSDLAEWKERCPFVSEQTSVMDAIIVDSEHRAGLVCVLNEFGVLLGVVSDGDIRRAIRDDLDLKSSSVSELMNRNPVTLQSSLLVGGAINAMETPDRKVFSSPVVDGDMRCLGVVTLHDLIRR